MRMSSYLALSRQAALEREMTTIANNLANATTTAFRAEHTVFEEALAPGRPPLGRLRAGRGAGARSVARADHADRQSVGPRDRGAGLFRLRDRWRASAMAAPAASSSTATASS